MESLNQYNDLISNIAKVMNNQIMAMSRLLSSCAPWSAKKDEIAKEYRFDEALEFNFFTSISDFYYRENFHSDILKVILNPSTDLIGNKLYLDIFIDVLKEIKKADKLKHFSEDVTVEREEGRIDILIYDSSKAIIVENKGNLAGPRESVGKILQVCKRKT